MKTSGRMFYSPSGPLDKARFKPKKISKLKDLSDASLWSLRESMGRQIIETLDSMTRIPLYYLDRLRSLEALVIGLEKRFDDLSRELDNRLMDDEQFCSFYGPAYRDRYIQPFIEQGGVVIVLDREVNEVKNGDLKPPRKSLAKVPNGQFNGYKKKGFDKKIPNPKNRIRVDRSKIRKSYQ